MLKIELSTPKLNSLQIDQKNKRKAYKFLKFL